MDILEVSKRDMTVKAKQLRRLGQIPGHVFGGHLQETVLIQAEKNALTKLLAVKPVGSRLTLSMDGKQIPVQIKDKDVDSMSGQIRNVSFQALAADQKVNSVLHIVLLNTDKNTNMLEFMVTEIPYDALPQDMVDRVEIDVDGLAVGTVITVGDLKQIDREKVELHMDPEEIVLRISDPKRYAKDAPEEEAAEPAAEE